MIQLVVHLATEVGVAYCGTTRHTYPWRGLRYTFDIEDVDCLKCLSKFANQPTQPTKARVPMPLSDLNEGLKGGGAAPFWPSKNPGDAIQGTIKDGGKFQGTKYDPNPNAPAVPDTWPNGDPKYTYFLVLEGTGMATEGGDDTWTVTLSSHRWTAATEALKAAGADEFREGGRFGLKYVGERRNRAGTANYKHFEAYYQPPAVSAGWGVGQAQAPAPEPAPSVPQAGAPFKPAPEPRAQAYGNVAPAGTSNGWPTPSSPIAQQDTPDAGHTVQPAWPTPPQGGRQLT